MQPFLALALLTFTLGGCAHVSRIDAGHLTAFGEPLEKADQYLYYLVRIDNRGRPADELPPLAIRFPEADRPIAFDALTPSVTARYLPAFVPPPQWPPAWKEKASRRTAFEGGGIYVGFEAQGPAFIELCSHCHRGRHSPVLCAADGSVCHQLPVTYEGLVELIGPPDRVQKVREVTY
ncbi:MAG: hypothetical protein ACQER6_04830 [Pseudomonadota bacterium]